MAYFADRVKETTTTSGTGSITLAGAATGYRAFQDAFTGACTVCYCIVDGSAWEVGCGTFNGTTTLTRDLIRASSNSNNAINLSGGSADVFCTAPAEAIDNANISHQIAVSTCQYLP